MLQGNHPAQAGSFLKSATGVSPWVSTISGIIFATAISGWSNSIKHPSSSEPTPPSAKGQAFYGFKGIQWGCKAKIAKAKIAKGNPNEIYIHSDGTEAEDGLFQTIVWKHPFDHYNPIESKFFEIIVGLSSLPQYYGFYDSLFTYVKIDIDSVAYNTVLNDISLKYPLIDSNNFNCSTNQIMLYYNYKEFKNDSTLIYVVYLNTVSAYGPEKYTYVLYVPENRLAILRKDLTIISNKKAIKDSVDSAEQKSETIKKSLENLQ